MKRSIRLLGPAGAALAWMGPFASATRYLPRAMVIAIVVTWALLGLGVFIIAMRGPQAPFGGSRVLEPAPLLTAVQFHHAD